MILSLQVSLAVLLPVVLVGVIGYLINRSAAAKAGAKRTDQRG